MVISEESLINEVRSANKIIPLEVELSESILIDKSFSDLSVFKKTKTITYYANCSYSIDLSQLNSTDINIDTTSKKITLYLLPPEIFSINIDETKTKYSEPELGWLRFGDIKLTSEDFDKTRNMVNDAFKDKMKDKDLNQQVITNATISLEKLISDLVGENYEINIKIKNT